MKRTGGIAKRKCTLSNWAISVVRSISASNFDSFFLSEINCNSCFLFNAMSFKKFVVQRLISISQGLRASYVERKEKNISKFHYFFSKTDIFFECFCFIHLTICRRNLITSRTLYIVCATYIVTVISNFEKTNQISHALVRNFLCTVFIVYLHI